MFIDNLAIELFSIAFFGILMLYMTIGIYYDYKKRGVKNVYERITPAIVPLALIGIFISIMALIGEITWPLPGSYNILFYAPYIMLGIIILGFVVSSAYKNKLSYIGILALFTGIMLFYYGYEGYKAGLTQSPLALFALYVAFGFAGILAYPVTLMLDTLPGAKKNPSVLWSVALYLFWFFIFAGVVLAAFTGVMALPSHLASPP